MIVPCLLFFAAVWQIVAEDDCTPNNAATAANLMQKKHVRSALLNATRDPVGFSKRKNSVEGADFIGHFEGWAIVVWVQMLVRARWVENFPVCKLKADMFHQIIFILRVCIKKRSGNVLDLIRGCQVGTAQARVALAGAASNSTRVDRLSNCADGEV